ncbi:MAG: proteasome accessory factor PafA2 family protein, partial [Actinomycetales bacterium]|nr:proteasome accessory factor PafA2 family protein [Actinomycetales bacterium]
HPEYSTPEVTGPRAAALWDLAGEAIMRLAAQRASELTGNLIVLYKNNTDGKGASYGTHENYQVSRSVAFETLVQHLTPFFISRNIITGTGRVGIGQESERAGFQIAQRADFFEATVGLETTVNRPIINTRDEPHADRESFRRLHVIVGDANLSPQMTFLKMGMTALLLSMIEAGFPLPDFALVNPVTEMHKVSHDYELRHLLTLTDGQKISALDLQLRYLEVARDFVGPQPDPETASIIDLWAEVLQGLATNHSKLIGLVDWISKKSVLDSFRNRDALNWTDAKLSAIDLQYSDIRVEQNLAGLIRRGSSRSQMFGEHEVADAISNPPTDTRAFTRGKIAQRYSENLLAAAWESMIFEMENEVKARITLRNPQDLDSTRTGELFQRDLELKDFLSALAKLTEVEY